MLVWMVIVDGDKVLKIFLALKNSDPKDSAENTRCRLLELSI